MKNERKEVIWPTPTLSQDGYLMEFRPEQFSNHIKRVEHDTSLIFCSSSMLRRQHIPDAPFTIPEMQVLQLRFISIFC